METHIFHIITYTENVEKIAYINQFTGFINHSSEVGLKGGKKEKKLFPVPFQRTIDINLYTPN